MAKSMPLVSPVCAKAIGLLRSHYVYVVRLMPTGFSGLGRIPDFTWDYGIFNTRTGARVMGFWRQDFPRAAQTSDAVRSSAVS